MCLLILLRGLDPDFPLLVGSNRDEHRARKAAPPGLHVGMHRRMLGPRDRVAAGTWIAVNDGGMFAALTNRAGLPERPEPTSRGELPYLALDQADLAAAVAAIQERCAAAAFNPFQLLLADAAGAVVLEHADGQLVSRPADPSVVVLSNEHRLGELVVPEASGIAAPDLALADRIARLQAVLRDQGDLTGHRILKRGGEYGTVSSSVVAVPAGDILQLQWWYAAGQPDQVPYRNYGNLARRLLPPTQ